VIANLKPFIPKYERATHQAIFYIIRCHVACEKDGLRL